MNNEKNIITKNFLWRLAERCGAQGVSFFVSIVLARLLTPDDYGIVSLITVFITILNVFVDSGLGNALIQKQDVTETDFSTVFYFNIAWCMILYLILFAFSPIIASVYGNESLISMIRVAGIAVLISGVKNVQQAYISRNMQFKKFFYSTLAGTIVSAFVGVLMAYKGYGAWALIFQYISNMLIDTIVLSIVIKWHPHNAFSITRLKLLFSYGWKLLASSLLETLYSRLRELIIGMIYTTESLAYYTKGENFPSMIVSNINSSLDSVLFPAMSREQDKVENVKMMTKKAIKISSFVIWPLMVGLSAISEPIIRLLLTEKWLPSALYMRVFCFVYVFIPIHTANLNALKAMGRSDIFLKLEIKKKVVGILALIGSVSFGVKAIVLVYAATIPICLVINAQPNKKLINYSLSEQIRDILPYATLSIFMGICVWCICLIGINDLLTVVIQILVGSIVYFAGAYLLRFDALEYLHELVNSYNYKN